MKMTVIYNPLNDKWYDTVMEIPNVENISVEKDTLSVTFISNDGEKDTEHINLKDLPNGAIIEVSELKGE